VGRGRGRQRKSLLKRIRKLGLDEAVSIEPAVPHHEVPALLAQSDICVAPLAVNDRNLTQGCCPIKVIESLAAGRPLVAANLPVVRELAREEVDALLFAPNDPADLARQILRVVADRPLAARLAASGAEHARTHFTWHAAQKKLLKIYDRLLNDSPS
jgi:glycosyltransferase involved in cell wall biosynthesis